MTDVTQGELIKAPARANHLGDPCPAWCAIDHREVIGTSPRTGEGIRYTVHVSAPHGPAMGADAVAVKHGYDAGLPTWVQLRKAGRLVDLAVSEAPGMADLLDAIAEGKIGRDEVRHMAARVREVLAQLAAVAT